MNTWSQEEQQQQELHESSVNRLYECKPVKTKIYVTERYSENKNLSTF